MHEMCRYLLQLERPDSVGCELLDVRESDVHVIVRLCLRYSARPVLITLDARTLFQFCHHDNRGATLFPTHSPKISEGFRQWALKIYNSLLFHDRKRRKNIINFIRVRSDHRKLSFENSFL